MKKSINFDAQDFLFEIGIIKRDERIEIAFAIDGFAANKDKKQDNQT